MAWGGGVGVLLSYVHVLSSARIRSQISPGAKTLSGFQLAEDSKYTRNLATLYQTKYIGEDLM